MIKLLCLLLLLFATGCANDENKLYLEDELYGENEFIVIDENKINELYEKKATYILFTNNNFCSMQISCDKIFEEFMQKKDIGIYSIPFTEFKNTYLYGEVKYAPSIMIVKDGELYQYLDVNKDEDYEKDQDGRKFTKWVNSYISLKKK